MMLMTVKGVYKDGKVELAETPNKLEEAEVLVIFLSSRDEDRAPEPKSELPVNGEEMRQAARERAFARMERGYHLGGSPYPGREELYDRTHRHR